MPRGKYVNHKGRNRHFTSPEKLQQLSEEDSQEEVGGSEEEMGATKKPAKPVQLNKQLTELHSTSSESDDDLETEARDAKKGVASLIEIVNPNRMTKKSTLKLSQLRIDDDAGASTNKNPELSRRERELIEKQKARQRYEKLHAAGKTSEAKSDLARLSLIRQQREEAAAKREAMKKPTRVDPAKKSVSK